MMQKRQIKAIHNALFLLEVNIICIFIDFFYRSKKKSNETKNKIKFIISNYKQGNVANLTYFGDL